MSSADIYREIILDYYRNPRNYGKIENPDISQKDSNPLCGDELEMNINLKDNKVSDVKFTGKGCAISQAASSMLAAEVEGKSIQDARKLIETMKGLMRGKEPDASVELGDLEALAGVRKFPVRIKCAALSWNVVEQGLQQWH